MKIIYLTTTCAQQRFDKLVREGKIKKMPQAQKYHHLMLTGLKKYADQVSVVANYPIVLPTAARVKKESEVEDGIEYTYPSYVNIPLLRQIMIWAGTVKAVLSNYTSYSIIVCDVLNYSICLAARFVRLFKRVKIVGIVTDVPGHTSGARAKMLPKWKQVLRKSIVSFTKKSVLKYDGYLLLTEAMNEVVNPKKKPYVVIEGHSDIEMGKRENKLEEKDFVKTIMYAGGTHKEFGMGMLVDAFLAVNHPEWELHIYGDGNYQAALTRIASEYPNVKYFGMHPNCEIVDAQFKAWLLVNPRITDAEYVKYSFPSKTLECMVSGTPLLTTKLPGMPKDYYPFVYLFEDETQEGFEQALKTVFELPAEELHRQGSKAREFALTKKNNVKQAEKFYNFLVEVLK